MPKPRVIYEAKPGSPIAVDHAFYDRLAREGDSRTLVEQFVVPMRSGRAWPVRAGQVYCWGQGALGSKDPNANASAHAVPVNW